MRRLTTRGLRHAAPGRSINRLLADVDAALSVHPTTTAEEHDQPGPRRRQPKRRPRPGSGWVPTAAPLAVWRMTSDQTPACWPLIPCPGLSPTGACLGIDLLSGGAFYADPAGWCTRDAVGVTNPNVFVYGKPGRGKSGTVKMFCLRMADFGYRTLILGDVKDEYTPLCRAFGVEPFTLGPGQPARLNPLDVGPLGHGWDRLDPTETRRRAQLLHQRWLGLIRGLVGTQRLGEHPVPFGPTEEAACASVLADLTGPLTGATALAPVTIPQLWHGLDEPTRAVVAACRYRSAREFTEATRLLRDTLATLVTGHLAGLFDDHTSIDVDWSAPIQSVSLSRLEAAGDTAVGIALLCCNSWGQAMREVADPGDLRIIVRDETWKQLRLGIEPVKALDANLRLSRADGDIQVVVCHKPSDPLSAGAADSQAVAIARDLLHLADIRVLHGQDKAVAEDLADLLGMTPMATRLVTGWAMAGKGRAVWMVGDRYFKVQTQRTRTEAALTFTNSAVSAAA